MNTLCIYSNRLNKFSRARSAGAIALAALLAACGGGGDESSSTTPSASGPTAVAGVSQRKVEVTFVVPRSIAATSKAALEVPVVAVEKSAACPLVPDGYEPAAQVAVELLSATGAVIQTLSADACGKLSADVPDTVSSMRAQPAGFQPVTVYTGQAATGTVASALPGGARLEIAALQVVGGNALSALIVDSISKKAVLGLPQSAFSATAGGGAIQVTGAPTQLLTGNPPFSTVMVMDASGSMGTCAANCRGDAGFDATKPSYNRFQLAARAAHRFLDDKSADDEVGMMVFDDDTTWIADAAFVNRFRTATNTPASYTFSADGFTRDATGLRLPVDYYNSYSALWRATGDALHPVTVARALRVSGGHPWSGSTALFTATKAAVDRVAPRTLPRKIVIAMTDGQNNSGRETLETAVAAARAAGVPVYTIGFGLSSTDAGERQAIAELQSMASRTGADSTIINGPDIVGLFAGLQTAIRFETTLTLERALAAGEQVSLVLTVPGQPSVSRTLTVAAPVPARTAAASAATGESAAN